MSPNQSDDCTHGLVNAINIVCYSLLSDFPVSLLMFNMFVVALVPIKLHCYFY